MAILGRTGRNFGAGMSGGIAYVLDRAGDFASRCNMETLELEPMVDPEDILELRALIQRHEKATGSTLAKSLLADWDNSLGLFKKVMPTDYKRVLMADKNSMALKVASA